MRETDESLDKDGVSSAQGSTTSHRRRDIVLAGAGLLAAVGGGTLAWRNFQPEGSVREMLPDTFWQMGWDDPRGQRLQLHSFKGHPLLINFWATWCAPCIEELPLINTFYLQNKEKGWRVLGLAIDRPVAVMAFLKKYPVDFSIGLAGLSGSELGKNLGNVSEALPFSVVISSDGSILQRKLGRLKAEELTAWSGLK